LRVPPRLVVIVALDDIPTRAKLIAALEADLEDAELEEERRAHASSSEQRGFPDTVAGGVTVVYVVKGLDAVMRGAVEKRENGCVGQGTVTLEDESTST
jgi:hypothetical protein